MKTLEETLPKLSSAERAVLIIGPKYHGWTITELRQWLYERTGEEVDEQSVENYLRANGVQTPTGPPPGEGGPGIPPPFSSAMERDIELALLAELPSLGLKLFTDQSGRNGQQYPAEGFGQIDLLATDSNGDFVVIELKRDEVPRATIGQVAGYIAFVKNHLADATGHSVVGWIVARHSSPAHDRFLTEAANAVGILVKWYRVRVELLQETTS